MNPAVVAPDAASDVAGRMLDELFPFHVALDDAGAVLRHGRSTSRLCPGLQVGDPIATHLRLVSPGGPLTVERLRRARGRLVVFQTPAGVMVRGQVIVSADVVTIVGSPWFTEPEALTAAGLTIADFAPHDPTPDFLIVVQQQSTALTDTRRLAERLEQMDAERRRLEEAERALARDLNALPDLMLRLDVAGTVLDYRGSTSFSEPDEPVVGRDVFEVFPGMQEHLRGALLRTFQSSTTQSFEYVAGSVERPEYFEARIVRCSPAEALLLVRDVSERRSLEHQLAHQAFHDTLTGLPNRARFQERLRQAVVDGSAGTAVLFVDLDDFKQINDTLGHAAGDEMLMAAAERLRTCVRPGDLVARLGGDEFALLLAGVDRHVAGEVAARLVDVLSEPVVIDGRPMRVGASVGAVLVEAVVDEVERYAEELLRSADVAMYWAKASGKGRTAFFDPAMDERIMARLQVESALRTAIAEQQFVVHYQPIVGLDAGRVVGVEALVRWERPGGCMVPPAEFIPLAEQTGLIGAIGEHVLRTACQQVRTWDETFPDREPLELSVNLSAVQLLDPGIVELVGTVLAETGLPAERLTVEITETALISETERVRAVVEGLAELGVRLALDDFGTGFSSLSHLREFPIDQIKIDRLFISSMFEAGPNGAIAAALLGMSRILRVGVVAEGVEEAEQVTALQQLGCPSAQGYYFAEPMDARNLSEILRADPVVEVTARPS
jgi:diguanylate cyclase (GGDEF)-like protein